MGWNRNTFEFALSDAERPNMQHLLALTFCEIVSLSLFGLYNQEKC